MTRICDFNGIYWKNPFDRWFMEALCGRGGTLIIILAVLLLITYLIVKLSDK